MKNWTPTEPRLRLTYQLLFLAMVLISTCYCVNQKTYLQAVPKPNDPKQSKPSTPPTSKKPVPTKVNKSAPQKLKKVPGPAKKSNKPANKQPLKKQTAKSKSPNKTPKPRTPIPKHAMKHGANSTNKTTNATNISAPLLPEILPPEHFNLTIVDPDHERHRNLTRQLHLLKQKLHKAKQTVSSFRDEAFVEALQEQMEDLLKKVKYDGDIVTKMKKEPVPKGAAQKGENEQRLRTKKDSTVKIKKYLSQRDKMPPRQRLNLSKNTLPKSTLNNDKRFKVLREVKSPFKKYPKKKLEANKKISIASAKPTKLLEL